MGIVPETARQKIWFGLIALAVLSGVASAEGIADAAGLLTGGFLIYYLPILVHSLLFSNGSAGAGGEPESA